MGGPTDWGNSWVGFGFPRVGLAGYERMAVAQNKDGHLEIFVVGSDGAVWHRWQVMPNRNWSEWASFGQPDGVSFAVDRVPPIQVEQNEDGRLEVFLQGDDKNVWHIWQVIRNANWIDHWTSLSRPLDVNASLGLGNSLVRNQGSELEIFVQGVGPTGFTEVWSIWQVVRNGIWADSWTNLGVPPVLIRQCFPVLNANNVLEVLAVGFDGAIWHNVRAGTPPTPWRGWSVMIDRPSGVDLSEIEALWQNQDGRLELVCSARNRDYWHTWQSSPSPDNWSGFWDNFGQPPGGASGGGFDMRLDTKGLLEGLTMGNDFVTYLISQSAQNNGWTGWGGLSRIDFSLQPNMIMSQNQDGRLEAFTRSGDSIAHIAQLR
jgi:hypothetical protein